MKFFQLSEPLPPEELKIPDTQQSDADIDLKCDQKEIQRQATCLDKDFKPFKPKKETPKKKPAPLKLTHTEWDAVGINSKVIFQFSYSIQIFCSSRKRINLRTGKSF